MPCCMCVAFGIARIYHITTWAVVNGGGANPGSLAKGGCRAASLTKQEVGTYWKVILIWTGV